MTQNAIVKLKSDGTATLSLFTSTGTLLCCALPTLLVTLGLGTVVASTLSSVPFLMTLSRNKGWTFLIAGLAIALNFYLVYRKKSTDAEECEVDLTTGEAACDVATNWNKRILWVTVVIYIIGFTVSYLAFPALMFLGLL